MSIEKKALNRMNYLLESQPHDHEWDCPYDELEYFILKAITQPVYEEKSDSFEENPLLKLSFYKKQKEIKRLANDLKKGIEIESLLLEYSQTSQLNHKVLSVLSGYLGYYNHYQYFGRLAASDVLLQSIITFLNTVEMRDYNPEKYNLSSLWVEIIDMENKLIGDDTLPGSDTGWVKCKVKNKHDSDFFLSFLFWDGCKFKTSQTKELNEDIVSVVAWKEITNDDLTEYLDFKRRILVGSLNILSIFKEPLFSPNSELFDEVSEIANFEKLKKYMEEKN